MKQQLEKLKKIKRERSHPLIHKIHKKHRISKKTLFYIKEYGPKTNATKTIIRESIKILLFASIISAFGGIALEQIKTIFVSILPLVILLPILNDMLGDYGTIISSRVSTMLHEGVIKKQILKNKEVINLFWQIMGVSIITAFLSLLMSLIVSFFSDFELTNETIFKITVIVFIDVLIIVSILFFISIFAGVYLFNKKEDPNNFLIPITTSIADFANMIVLAVLAILFF